MIITRLLPRLPTPATRLIDFVRQLATRTLVGLKIAAGFTRAFNTRLGGVQGCTHLSEIVRILATVAFQTIRTDSKEFLHHAKAEDIAPSNNGALPKGLQGTCHAFAPDTEVSKRVFDKEQG